MAAESTRAIRIFYCYAHEDKSWRDELEKHLSPLERRGQITEWYDRQIQPGEDWEQDINVHLSTADIILLLVSADFIHSDYCWSVEMQRAFERHRAGSSHIIPIILRPVSWEETPIGELQLLPTEGIPVTRWADRDEAFKDIAKGVGKVVTMLIDQFNEAKEESPISTEVILPKLECQGEETSSPLHKMKEKASALSQSLSPLHFIWIVDCSGSMAEEKLNTLNLAVRAEISEMREVAQLTPHVQVLVRCIGASSGARWHIAKPTSIEKLQWRDLNGGGALDIGAALRMVAGQLTIPPMHSHGLPPILVLITQGYATDDFEAGLRMLMEQPWGKKALRIAIGVDGDSDYTMLQKFIGNPALHVLEPRNGEHLHQCIKWVSTVPVKVVSALSPQHYRSIANFPSLPFPAYIRDQEAEDDVW